ncbi:MAG: hypothetical protein WCS65_12415 [Verrucomicrobiae bacterium]
MSIVNLILRNPFDKDALAFCTATGATDRRAISDFVRGIKRLSLWDSMVCWPLRSAQNFGTGTVVQSLGGLTQNGTLTNGPTWGADGVVFDGTNDAMVLADIVGWSGPYTLSYVGKADVGAANGGIPISGGWSRGAYLITTTGTMTLYAWAADASATGSQTALADNTAFHGISVSGSEAGFVSSANGTATFADASKDYSDRAPGNGSWVQVGALRYSTGDPIDNAFDGQIAFALVAKAALTAVQQATLYSLYKSTLGIGLNLP